MADHVTIEGAIIDKNCAIGTDAVITNLDAVENTEEHSFGQIRDGIICVEKSAVIPAKWNLAQYLRESAR